MKKILHWRRVIAGFMLVTLILVSTRAGSAQTVTEGFGSDQPVQRSMIVKLKTDDPTKIEAITQATANESFGIVVGANESPLTLSSEGQSYFVATIGTYDTLVSTQQGPVKKGDYIAVSSIAGIGMAATQDDQTVIGIALGEFDGSKDVASTPTLKKSDGSEQQIAVGRVRVDIAVGRNPHYKTPEPDVPTALQRLTQTVAGKKISPFRAYISVIIFLLTAATAGSLMYGGVRSAMISVGRNPLSKKSIVRSMLQVVVTGLIIFISGLFGVYLILRL